MALAIQSNSNTSLLATVSTTFATKPTQDNLLIAVVTASVGVGSITLSNTGWTSGATGAVGLAGGVVVFYKISDGTTNDNTITANATLAAFMDIQIFEYPQVDDETPFDLTATTADSGSGVTSRASGTTGTLNQANELAFVVVATAGANGGSASWTNSFNLELTTAHLITGDILTTTTTAVSSTASWATSQRAVGLILTFFGEVGDTYGLRIPLKPRLPIVNWAHPITKGLVFGVPFTERGLTPQDVVGRSIGATSGTPLPLWGFDQYGSVMNFAGTASAGASLEYTLQANAKSASKWSIHALVNMTGFGANNAGTIFRTTDGTNSEISFRTDNVNGIVLTQLWSGATATYKPTASTNFTTNTISSVIVTYDGSSTANIPVYYLNGIPLAVSTITPASGTITTSYTKAIIGNIDQTGNVGTRTWQGNIGAVHFWKRILNVQEIKQLYANPWVLYKQLPLEYYK